MINNIFNFGDAKAKDIMTPRTDMVTVSCDVSYEEFVALVNEEGFSRFPVYDEDIDDIVGILYVKDVFFVDKNEFCADKYMREPYFTYETKPVAELFSEMRQNHLAVAIVLDEYGGTSGLATMEDIIEEIMGEIADEYDDEQDEIEVIKEDEYVVDGGTRLEEFNKMVGSRLESDEVDTIAGYVLMILGNFPEGGEILESDGLKFVVEEMDKNRISKLRVYINHTPEEA
ncbi:hemolysin family protein [Anaerotignum sp.]|uniref:hemolysin family protein n=1 Tax=Anaerotignum sp. TaxID=2039241 RepID=UPI00289DA727|nr:hemolysin family protein [Anaerotignum sp.]